MTTSDENYLKAMTALAGAYDKLQEVRGYLHATNRAPGLDDTIRAWITALHDVFGADMQAAGCGRPKPQ